MRMAMWWDYSELKMNIKLTDPIKSCSAYPDKLFHPRKTIKNGAIALRKLKPSIAVRFKSLDYIDRLNIPVYSCTTNATAKKIYPSNWMFAHVSYGKGKTSIQAKASAMMEFLERFSAYSFFKNDGNFIIAARNRIKNKTNLEDLLLSIPKEFRKDAFICNELKKAPLKWTRSFSLTHHKDILFPLYWFVDNSTGFASGNCIEEAILQGTCEYIERHQIAVIMGKKLNTPLIDIRSIHNIYAKKIMSSFNRVGVKLFIKDFSRGFNIPTIGILAYDPKGPKSVKIYCAAGTSLNRDIALIRALTEIAQHRSQFLFKKEEGFTFGFPLYKNLKEAECFTDSGRIIDFSELPTYQNKNIRLEVESVVRNLKNKGFGIIVTDVTHPVIKIPTVIVTIPGMQIPGIQDNPFLKLNGHYAQGNNYSQAVKILEYFLKFYPSRKKRSTFLFLCGRQYERLGKFKEAIGMYKKISSLANGKYSKPMRINTYQALIRCYTNLKKADKVFPIIQKLINVSKDNG
jgi:ribosomal protein S12 methylthiotransferase accessory factor